MSSTIRVFPHRNKWTPIDDLVFIGDPPLILPPEMPVRVSCTFTWDKEEALRLQRSWSRFYQDVQVGGPAFNDAGDEFEPGLFIKEGVVITSRGCNDSCPWCFVPSREGKLRELKVKQGWIIQDNNLLQCSQEHIWKVITMLIAENKPAKFSGGLDTKLFSKWFAEWLDLIKVDELWFSCDTDEALGGLKRVKTLLKHYPIDKLRCYVLCGFDGQKITQAEKRLLKVYDLGFLPFAQLYRPIDSIKRFDREWHYLIRKWSRPAAYKTKRLRS